MQRRPARFFRAVARFMRPHLRELRRRFREAAATLLQREDLVDAWIDQQALEFDQAHDFSAVPYIGEHLELWDREIARQVIAYAVDEWVEELTGR